MVDTLGAAVERVLEVIVPLFLLTIFDKWDT